MEQEKSTLSITVANIAIKKATNAAHKDDKASEIAAEYKYVKEQLAITELLREIQKSNNAAKWAANGGATW
jgi:NADH:ubiquinone oxidoreductase subunit E